MSTFTIFHSQWRPSPRYMSSQDSDRHPETVGTELGTHHPGFVHLRSVPCVQTKASNSKRPHWLRILAEMTTRRAGVVSFGAAPVTNYQVFLTVRTRTYKKFPTNEEAKQHSLTTSYHSPNNPITMRLSVFALFIALPAAAYAAVSPVQRSPDSGSQCVTVAGACTANAACCAGLQCAAAVRLMPHSL
ncbi:hypothetical protein DFH94DRAFT_279156 [Russula ochroleuca]|jgi:hypothetical protein|uniref:Uncharacterized protein n=1 Tax=Russula ochroleuca TaxID=152965 RepID=A0A9P5JWN8_9AGAM|nr:hypothetical protein DFH94DRAFT_279156 [Russula ochroleuca]